MSIMAGMLALASCASSDQAASSSSQPAQSSAPKVSSSTQAATEMQVPNVISLTRSDAEKAIVAAGLMVGATTTETSETVPAGHVISQNPQPMQKAAQYSKVELVVSAGKAQPKEVAVPDLKGKTQHDAEQALKDVGLVGVASNPEETDAVAPGTVFKQSVAAGTTLTEGDVVAFTVALAVAEVEVPNVVGMSQANAKDALSKAGFGFDMTTGYDNSIAQGNVISQSYPAGMKVKKGTTVSVLVSLGAKPADNVAVPDVATYSWSAAEHALTSAGLTARYTGDPAGVVVAQDVAAGTKVAPGTLVTVKLAKEAEKVEVPDLVGLSVESAEEVTDRLGLELEIFDGAGVHGTVEDQDPDPHTMVNARSTILVYVDDSDFRNSDDLQDGSNAPSSANSAATSGAASSSASTS